MTCAVQEKMMQSTSKIWGSEVLHHLAEYGICVKHSKCHFMCDSITFLGHKTNAEEKHTLPDKPDDVMKAPKP